MHTLRTIALLGILLLPALLRAQPALTLGVSEGTSGGLDHAGAIAKYGRLADVLGAASKRKVQVVFAREFASLEDGMRRGFFDFVLARPSDYPARGIRDFGYQYVASAKPEGQCLVVAGKDSPLKSLVEAKGKRWVLPEQVSYMSKFCTAELRDQGIDIAKERHQFVREQGAVVFYIDNGFSDVGAIASYSGPAKALAKSGHRVLHRSVTQPYFPLIASKRITTEQVNAIQAELRALPQSPQGREILKTIGIDSFDTESGARLKQLLGWLERK
jgi:phosphonate transport system substrate-binding protein